MMVSNGGLRRFAARWFFLAGAVSAMAGTAPIGSGPITTAPGTLPRPSVGGAAILPGSLAIPATLPGLKRFQPGHCDGAALLRKVAALHVGQLTLELGAGMRWELDLERVSMRAPGYRVRILGEDGVRETVPVEDHTFRGSLRGRPGSHVRLSFTGGKVSGYIDAGDGDRTYIEPMEDFDIGLPASAHAVYRHADADMNGKTPTCGFESALPVPGLPRGMGMSLPPDALGNPFGPASPTMPALAKAASGQSATGAAGAEPCALVEIGVAAEYSMVKGWGTAAKVEERINSIMNQVEGLYEDARININIQITEMFIEASAKQTWGPMDINTYLPNIITWAKSANGFKNPYDVADLWYYDPLVATSTTGLAHVGTVCSKTSGGHVIRDFTKTNSFLIINQAHELGHNFGANHVNNEKSILNPMILGDNLAWDDITINAILNHKHTRTCLSSCSKGPTADFTMKAPTPCSDTRTFTDISKGDPTSWSWDFGDGGTSKEQSPVHVYGNAGTFTPRLVAANAAGTNLVTKGSIKVKPFALPEAAGARACTPGPMTLTATGTGLLKWYDQPLGGTKLGEGATFQTPSVSQTRTFYVEAGDPDPAVQKLGPVANTIGAGAYFTANSDRRLYFDVNRPALLKSAKVYATGAGPRTIEVLDQDDIRVAARTVQVPTGESRIALDFELEPGHDYAIKYSGSPDSLNLYRNSAGAVFPYKTKDSLLVITHSDAVTSDSTSQSGYYYFFYDLEVQERGCGSARVPVIAEINCTPIAGIAGHRATALRQLGAGRWVIEGEALAGQDLEIRLRRLDGSDIRRRTATMGGGAFSLDVDLAGLPSNLYLLEVRQGGAQALHRLLAN